MREAKPRRRGRWAARWRCVIVAAAWTGAGVAEAGKPATPEPTSFSTVMSAPVAVRGGVLMVPLRADRAAAPWPASIPIRLEDGRVLEGAVAWIEPAEPSTQRRWTEDPRQVVVREVRPGDGAAATPTGSAAGDTLLGPWLVVRLPDDGQGRIKLGSQTLQPRWFDPPPPIDWSGPGADAPGGRMEQMEMVDAPDRPDPRSPLEYWRWALLADRLGMAAPSTETFGAAGAWAAEHVADLWRVGLARLEAQHRHVARLCLEALTALGLDPGGAEHGQHFAAWVQDPRQAGALLAVLLSQAADDGAVVEPALAWCEARRGVLWWPEDDWGDAARVALVNRADMARTARLAWAGATERPRVIELGSLLLCRIGIDRPGLPSGGTALAPSLDPPQRLLQIEVGQQRWPVVVGPRVLEARPPGVLIGPLKGLLTLAEVEAGRQRLVPPQRMTEAHVRRSMGRWEVLLECHRPARGDRAPGRSLQACATIDDLAGMEAAAVLIGAGRPGGRSAIALAVAESGEHQLLHAGVGAGPEVHCRSYADRWYARIVLPDEWLPRQPDQPLLVGVIRAHGESGALESAPHACVPWRLDPGRVAIDLSTWADWPGD